MLGLLALVFGVVVPSAVAAPGDATYLTIDKYLKAGDSPQLNPGDPFNYVINVGCSEVSCADVVITDAIPAELNGFVVAEVQVNQTGTAAGEGAPTVLWNGSPTRPATVSDTVLTVIPSHIVPAGSATRGLRVGQGVTITLTLQVPSQLSPTWPHNGQQIVNEAEVAGSNSLPATDDVPISVTIPATPGVDVSKLWSPSTDVFSPGKTSTVTLGISNTSNVPATTLVLEDRWDEAVQYLDLQSVGLGALPAGATGRTVEAWNGTAWVPWADAALAGYFGIRVTYTGSIAIDAGATVELTFAQRAEGRDGAVLGDANYSVLNTATGTASAGGGQATDSDTKAHTVTAVPLGANITKDIAGGTVLQGEGTTGTIVASYSGDTPASSMVVSDLDYFTGGIGFGGFTTLTFPAGADSTAHIAWQTAVGAAPALPGTPFAEGTLPAAPAGATGFVITFTGPIAGGDSAELGFGITTTDTAAQGQPRRSTTNTATVEVTVPQRTPVRDSDPANLDIVSPAIHVDVDKQVRPATPVLPGDPLLVSLPTRVATNSTVTPTRIVVEDSISTAPEFWNAFDLATLQPTGVPEGATMRVQVCTSSSCDTEAAWSTVSGATYVGPITTGVVTLPATATGVRFVFEKAVGFALDSQVRPNLTFVARSALRDGSGPVAAAGTTESYRNTVRATGTAGPVTGTDEDSVDVEVHVGTGGPGDPGTGSGVSARKTFSETAVASQSRATVDSTLEWRVGTGYNPVWITDHGTGDAGPAGTSFDALNLVSIAGIGTSNDPLTNGWFLKWDSITAVEIWNPALPGADKWQDLSDCGTLPATGSFDGCVLSAAERAAATGLRIVVEPNDAARTTAINGGAVGVPAPGSGVAASSGTAMRSFVATWELRNTLRSDGSYVNADNADLSGGVGVIANVVRVTGFRNGQPTTADGTDTLLLRTTPPSVAVDKRSTALAPVGAVAGAPITFTSTARNDGTVRGTHLRITDPSLCSEGVPAGSCTIENPGDNPFNGTAPTLTESPFDYVTLTGISVSSSVPTEIDSAATRFWLLHDNGTTSGPLTQAALPTDLSDVVGVSVTFVTADLAAGGEISPANTFELVLTTELRSSLRSDEDEEIVLGPNETKVFTNTAFGQIWDVTQDHGAPTGDFGSVDVTLTGGVLPITATKSFDPPTIVQATAGSQSVMTLGAAATDAAVRPTSVSLRDDITTASPFWRQFDLVSLGAYTAPAGAETVSVHALVDGAWVTGAPVAVGGALALPAGVSAPNVTGIDLVFTAADGSTLDASWTTSVKVTVAVRATWRDAASPVDTGLEDDNVVLNSLVVTATTPRGPVSASANSSVTLSSGSRILEVNKLANENLRAVDVGQPVPWDLTVLNNGTGAVTLTQVSDDPGASLTYAEPSDLVPAPAFTFTAGPRSGEAVPVTVTAVDGEIVFTFTAGPIVLQPGEQITGRLHLELQPGVEPGQPAVNTMTATSLETLDECRWLDVPNNSLANPGVIFSPAVRTECGTTDFVSPSPTLNLYMAKGVMGHLGTATNNVTGEACVTPTMTSGDRSYYATPCLADSTYTVSDDIRDQWLLRTANTMTNPLQSLTLFDSLPASGDQMLILGSDRGSDYRPIIDPDTLEVVLPDGITATTLVEATTGTTPVCENTWESLRPPGEQVVCDEETWNPVSAVSDWTAVTGLRVTLDFGDTPLPAGGIVDVRYETHNLAATDTFADGAPAVVPASDLEAWNQFGGQWQWQDDMFSQRVVAPVGVHLRTGPIEIRKELAGALAQYAPSTITADVTCELPQPEGEPVQLDLGDAAIAELVKGADGTFEPVVIDGIPLGAECVVAESGATGYFGETTRTGPVTLVVAAPAEVTEETDPETGEVISTTVTTPQAQIASFTNTYSGLAITVTKRVEGAAPAGTVFEVTLACVVIVDGVASPITIDGGGVRPILAGETVTFTVPTTATCTVTETGTGAADATSAEIAVPGEALVTVVGVTVDLLAGRPGAVTFVNAYLPPPSAPPSSPPASPSTPASTTVSPTPPKAPLPSTGASVVGQMAAAALLLAGGAAALLVTRRRRTQ